MDAPRDRRDTRYRIAGRTLTGTVVRYGDVADVDVPPYGAVRERIEAGAFSPVPDVPLVMMHDDSLVIAKPGAYILNDTPYALTLRADLPEDSAALQLAKGGELSGFSFRYRATRERLSGRDLVVSRGRLEHVGLVTTGAYPDSLARVRARGDRGGRLGTIRGRVPAGARLDCECGPEGCVGALFERGAFDGTLRGRAGRDILAITDRYEDAIASRQAKGVRIWEGEDGALEYAIDIPNNDRGRKLLETMQSDVPVYARPNLSKARSTFERDGDLARYSEADVRAMVVKPTDLNQGWTAARLAGDGDDERPDGSRRTPRRRRIATWRM